MIVMAQGEQVDWEMLGIRHTELETMKFMRKLHERPEVEACSLCERQGYFEDECTACEGNGEVACEHAVDGACDHAGCECEGTGKAACPEEACEDGEVRTLCEECKGEGYIEVLDYRASS